ncbi:GntR family transcriptional regulator [Roseitranquillus sediminis]|uniref:GntR family transcriptional regulator n=1 Tax=Roseitranquillus sediminis TaxID=2809051 RepID=UPI001D0C063A|nr:GntR family transcriptional regulator [Roseitranquillus sediminis]MBM9594275.1 GntR family transcriptional regulator [Roseitranquillus sediminis]
MSTTAHERILAINATAPIGVQLIAALRERIMRAELPPGTRLSEQEIASAYGMSRQPVREAFIRLAAERLVEIRPQRGTFVLKIDIGEVEISRFVREAVEADIVRLAATTANRALADELERQIEQQASLLGGDTEAFLQLDELFHRTLAEAAGKAGAWMHLQPIKLHMDRVRYLTASEFPRDRLVRQHRQIAGAVAAGDARAAELAMRTHLGGVLDDLPRIVAAQPEFFERGPDVPGRH